ncbi:MAG: hypothetical protein P8099_20010, partial [Gemmatimonadota bacterium]
PASPKVHHTKADARPVTRSRREARISHLQQVRPQAASAPCYLTDRADVPALPTQRPRLS